MTDQEVMATLFGATMAAMLVFIVISLAVAILMIVVYWKLFTKAGEAGWKAIIPIYNSYVLYKIAKIPLVFFAWIVCIIISTFDNSVVALMGSIGMLITSILLAVNLAKAYGKSGGFAAGLILLPIIFYPILAFGSATYQD